MIRRARARVAPAPLAALLLALGATLSPPAALADSPLTSTDFVSAYRDVPKVERVATRGLDPASMDWLMAEGTPHDQAVAAINSLGFGKDGKGRNSIRLLARLHATDRARFDAFRKGRGSGHLLLVIGYAWAMDEYLETERAESLLRQAQRRLPRSFTVAFVLAIAEAQRKMAGPWCEVYRAPKRVIDRWAARPIDLRRRAIEDAMRYIDQYAEDCR